MNLPEMQDLLTQIHLTTPWARAVSVLGAAIILAGLINVLLSRWLPRLTARTKTDVDDQLVAALRSPLFVSVVLGGINIALLLLSVDEPFYGYSLSFLKTLGIIVWTTFFSRLARLILGALARNHDRFTFVQPQTLPALGNLATAIILGGSIYFLLLAWSINISAWVASAGIIGLAVSLAARDTLANLFAGMAILADTPYSLGDYIVLETGERGEVTRIGLRSSRILTRDDVEIIVPNTLLANSKIINEAGGPDRHYRVRCKVSVAYGSDIDEVRHILEEVAHGEEEAQENPAPRVRFRRFGDSGLELELLAWVPDPWMRGRVLDKLNTEVYKRFQAAGIEIPYPKRDVYIRSDNQASVAEISEEPAE